MADKSVVVYVASYTSADDAQADYALVKQLHSDGVIGAYDAAVISKDAGGLVKISTTEKPTQYGAWAGLAVGALAGIFFPPFLVWELPVGAVAGALIGHFWKGIPRSDLKEIGDTLQASTAALIVIGRSKVQEALAKATKRAVRQFEKELSIDVEAFNKDLTAAVDQFLKDAQGYQARGKAV